MKISLLFANPNQPRKTFNQAKLEELSESIKEHGLQQPIVVVKRKKGYMIVMGERRFRACKIAKLENI